MAGVTVTESASTAGRPPWIHLAGTIQEVIDELQNQNVSASQVVFYTDDATNAKAVFCRQS